MRMCENNFQWIRQVFNQRAWTYDRVVIDVQPKWLIDILPSWWRHQMETLSALLAPCAGNSPVAGEFPAQRPVTRSFDVFLDLRLNKRSSKQGRGWWCETPSRPLWRHCHDTPIVWLWSRHQFGGSMWYTYPYPSRSLHWNLVILMFIISISAGALCHTSS